MNLYSSVCMLHVRLSKLSNAVHQLIIQCNSRHIRCQKETNAYGMADNSYFIVSKHTSNHTYHLIYQYKPCFLPTEGIYGFRKILKMKPSPHPTPPPHPPNPMAQQLPSGKEPLNFQASRSQSDTPLSVELLWTSDLPDAENSTCKQIPMPPRRDSNPQSQKASGHIQILGSARMKPTSSLNSRNDMISVMEAKCFL